MNRKKRRERNKDQCINVIVVLLLQPLVSAGTVSAGQAAHTELACKACPSIKVSPTGPLWLQANRPLRQSSLLALNSIVASYSPGMSAQSFSGVITELSPLVG